ncbi:MAG: phosphonate metabolism protein/1,5-bisphosphokinase (PRPP-forming) PhnN [Halocynthiibacter sp.]
MTAGRLIAVVGPSGVGKDSVMAGIIERCPGIMPVRRTITRAADLGGEDYEAVTLDAFSKTAEQGGFCVHWGAHGLFYGIPRQVLDDVAAGAQCLVNFSRGALLDAAALFPSMVVLHITADPATLAARLAARNRETADDIQKRLAQAIKPLPTDLDVITIANDGALGGTVDAAIAALQAERS